MTTAEYYLLDVFTDQHFTGNPLAVFLNADGLDTCTMQALANELTSVSPLFHRWCCNCLNSVENFSAINEIGGFPA
ncbi:PhzF family phenazine biosynthesis protein, partial [Vreelandella aquamarina]|uniref:PhzF family phenazine biosynthesis protein n=1 Tax=Vreelandella aquamarina TaxID=77097 RepID=UPI003CFF8602